MATGSDIVTDALFACGALGQGDSLPNADAQLVLRRLNRMLDSWNNLRLSIFEEFTDTLPTVAGTASYLSTSLVGLVRPVRVTGLYIRSGTVDYPLARINAGEYADIATKADRAMPDRCWLEPSMPASRFWLYPVPDAVYTLYVLQHRPLPTTLTLATTLALPPGYEKALTDCLAVDIAPSFGRPVTQDMRQNAREAEHAIRKANYVPHKLDAGIAEYTGAGYQITRDF